MKEKILNLLEKYKKKMHTRSLTKDEERNVVKIKNNPKIPLRIG